MPKSNKPDYQTTPGQLGPCCVDMIMALHIGYIKKGFLWRKKDPPMWCGWTIKVQGKGYYDLSPIRFCPWCQIDLDKGEH